MTKIINFRVALAVMMMFMAATGTSTNELNAPQDHSDISPMLPVSQNLQDGGQPTASKPEKTLVRCYCNMAECLAATGGVRTCTTRQGCFFQFNAPANGPATSTGTTSTSSTTTTVAPIPGGFDDETVLGDSGMDGIYGCLDLLPTKKTCDEILTSGQEANSEFPTLQAQTNTDNAFRAVHCCSEDMCNDRTHIAATAQTVKASLKAVYSKYLLQQQHEPATVKNTEVVPPDTYPEEFTGPSITPEELLKKYARCIKLLVDANLTNFLIESVINNVTSNEQISTEKITTSKNHINSIAPKSSNPAGSMIHTTTSTSESRNVISATGGDKKLGLVGVKHVLSKRHFKSGDGLLIDTGDVSTPVTSEHDQVPSVLTAGPTKIIATHSNSDHGILHDMKDKGYAVYTAPGDGNAEVAAAAQADLLKMENTFASFDMGGPKTAYVEVSALSALAVVVALVLVVLVRRSRRMKTPQIFKGVCTVNGEPCKGPLNLYIAQPTRLSGSAYRHIIVPMQNNLLHPSRNDNNNGNSYTDGTGSGTYTYTPVSHANGE